MRAPEAKKTQVAAIGLYRTGRESGQPPERLGATALRAAAGVSDRGVHRDLPRADAAGGQGLQLDHRLLLDADGDVDLGLWRHHLRQ